MKYIILLSIILGSSFFAFTQNKQQLKIVRADSTWSKEIISFPIDWAPDLTLEGFEELRFSPKWDEPDSPQFWTLALSWKVNTQNALSPGEIQFNLAHYFDGLMKPNHWATEFAEPKVTVQLAETKSEITHYVGQMNFFDGFHTGKPITTYLNATQWFCKTSQSSTIVFQISAQAKNHAIWEQLHTIVPLTTACPK